MGYHKKQIPRGVYGEFSKIREEFLELEDALEQNNKVMALCEMADLIGAIKGYLTKHVAGVMIADILNMAYANMAAFEDGTRIDKLTSNKFEWLRGLMDYHLMAELLPKIDANVADDINNFLKRAVHVVYKPPVINLDFVTNNKEVYAMSWERGTKLIRIYFPGDKTFTVCVDDESKLSHQQFSKLPIESFSIYDTWCQEAYIMR